MKIIPIVNQKRGVGRTTVAMQLAAVLARRFKVLVVDSNPPQSAMRWVENARDRLKFDFVATQSSSVIARLCEASLEYDFMLVDTPGGFENTQSLESVLDAADFVVVPLTPEPLNIDPTMTTIACLIEPRQLPHKVLLNRIDERIPDQLVTWRKVLDTTLGIPRFDAYLQQCRAHTHAGVSIPPAMLASGLRSATQSTSDVTAFGRELREEFSPPRIGVW